MGKFIIEKTSALHKKKVNILFKIQRTVDHRFKIIRSACKTSCRAHVISTTVWQPSVLDSIRAVIETGGERFCRFPTPKCRRGPVIIKEAPRCCDRARISTARFVLKDLLSRGPTAAPRRAACALPLSCIESPAHEIPGNEEQIISSDGRTPVWSDERIARWLGALREQGERGPCSPLIRNGPHQSSFFPPNIFLCRFATKPSLSFSIRPSSPITNWPNA